MSDDAMIEKALDGLGRLHEALRTVEQQREEIASLRAEVERLETALGDAIELADDAIAYVPANFRDKWDMPATLQGLKDALFKEPGGRR